MVQIISVLQRKGGAGKSTLACCLASLINSSGAKVLVVDTDPQSTSFERIGKSEEAGLDTVQFYQEETLRGAVAHYSKNYDVIVIDTAGYDSKIAEYVIYDSDLVLIPSKAGYDDLEGATKTFAHIVQLKKKFNLELSAKLVMWGVDPSTKVFGATQNALCEFNLPFYKTAVRNLTGFERLSWFGGLPEGAARKDLNSLLAEMQMCEDIDYYTNQNRKVA